jgi:hypothetical protein
MRRRRLAASSRASTKPNRPRARSTGSGCSKRSPTFSRTLTWSSSISASRARRSRSAAHARRRGCVSGIGCCHDRQPYNIGRSLRGMPQPTRGRRNVRKLVGGFDREKDDFYPTPAPLTRALLALERFPGGGVGMRGGDGAMAFELQAAANVVCTDLVARGRRSRGGIDFLMERQLCWGRASSPTRRSSCGSSSPTTRSTSAPTRWCCSAACSTSKARPPRR